MRAADRTDDTRLIEALADYIPHAMRVTGVPGLNIAVARRGKLIWEAGFGYADLARQLPMSAQTVMRTGSMGKLYTATAVLQLVERGVLGLYDPLNHHLAGFQVLNPLGERAITIYDLLTHRAGLTSDAAGSDFAPAAPLGQHLAAESRQPMLREYARGVPRWSAKVGERYQYSNFGVALLGYVVEVTNPDGSSFSDYVQQHIFEPLGMSSSQFAPAADGAGLRPELYARLSNGYARLGPVLTPTPMVYIGEYPAGTSVTTPGDHLRLFLAMRDGGELHGRRILQPETVRAMLTPQVAHGNDLWTGLIWRINAPGTPEESITHSGAYMYGWNNYGGAFPALDVAVVVMTNAWDMVSWSDPAFKSPTALIPEFIATWLHSERPAPSPHTWGWKTAYVIGLLVTEQLKGALGIPSPLTPAMVDALTEGVTSLTGAPLDHTTWDADGFRAGIADMLATDLSIAGIRAFVASERMKVLPQELELIHRELGGRKDAPLP